MMLSNVHIDRLAPARFTQGVTKPGLGNKPCLLFQGHCWEQDLDFQNVQSMMIDFFRGEVISNLFLGMLRSATECFHDLTPSSVAYCGALQPLLTPLTFSHILTCLAMLAGIDRVIVFSADPPHIRMQQYTITFKKSGTRLPIVEVSVL